MMRTRLALCCCVLSGLCASALAADAEGTPGVNALLDRIEKAHTSRDAKMLIDQCTDDDVVAIVAVGPSANRTARLMTKQHMTAKLFNRMWALRQLKSRRKTDRDIMLVQPDMAFVRATTVDLLGNGSTVSQRDLHIARRSGGTWRICFVMPQIFRIAFRIAYVLPDSPAQRAGLEVGDEVTVCGGIKTDELLATAKLNRLLKSEPKEVSLTARRGGQELHVTIPGSHGLGGTGLAAVLLPLAPATLVGPGAPHPIKEQIKRGLEALSTGRAGDLDAAYHPDGFFMYLPQAGRPTRVIGLEAIKALTRKGVEQHGKSTGTAKISVEGIRVITDGRVALTTGSITYVDKETGKPKSSPTRASVYVRRGEAWLLAADLGQPLRFGLPRK